MMAALTSATLRDLQRTATELGRRVRFAPHRIAYFHQVDDPYSHLAAQTLEPLCERYDIELEPHLAAAPDDDAAPDRARLEAFARKDAGDIAPAYGLSFPAGAPAPDPALSRAVAATLAAAPASAFARRAVHLGTALWAGDAQRIAALGERYGRVSDEEAAATERAGSARRRDAGHYLGATFAYGGEWYWGPDRLHYLEARLRQLGAVRPTAPAEPIVPTPATQSGGRRQGDATVVVEAFLSLRSPYSHLATARVLALPRRHAIELRLRPVLPMVMRGLQVPLAKRLYIVRDAKREADRLGLAFGHISDPVGEPVERAYALYPWARDHGRGGELLHSFTTAAFAEGIDTGTDDGLRHVVERAGLSWSEAQAHRADSAWRDELEDNRRAMLDMGLWGVPSFRVSGGDRAPFATWGQDRLWLVEREITARSAA